MIGSVSIICPLILNNHMIVSLKYLTNKTYTVNIDYISTNMYLYKYLILYCFYIKITFIDSRFLKILKISGLSDGIEKKQKTKTKKRWLQIINLLLFYIKITFIVSKFLKILKISGLSDGIEKKDKNAWRKITTKI